MLPVLIIASLACFRSDTEPEYRFKFVSASGMKQYLTLTMLWGRDANAVYAATHNLPEGARELRPADFPLAIRTALSLDEAQAPSPRAMIGLAAGVLSGM